MYVQAFTKYFTRLLRHNDSDIFTHSETQAEKYFKDC